MCLENLPTAPCPTEREAPTTAAPCLSHSLFLELLALVGMEFWSLPGSDGIAWQVSLCSLSATGPGQGFVG